MASLENELLCFRLKTKRKKKQLVREDKDKKIICLKKELHKVIKAQHDLGFAPLIPPVQRGWKRSFVLRPDLINSVETEFFQEILDKINTVKYSSRKDFKVKKRKKGKRVYAEKDQQLQVFSVDSFRKLKLNEKQEKYFRETFWYCKYMNRLEKILMFTEPWRFVLKVKPNIIDKIKIMDPLLKQREKEINDLLYYSDLAPRYTKLTGGNYKDYWNPRVKVKYKHLSKSNAISELINEYHLNQSNEE